MVIDSRWRMDERGISRALYAARHGTDGDRGCRDSGCRIHYRLMIDFPGRAPSARYPPLMLLLFSVAVTFVPVTPSPVVLSYDRGDHETELRRSSHSQEAERLTGAPGRPRA